MTVRGPAWRQTLLDQNAGVALLEDQDDLRLGKLGLLHKTS
jgi:hypothetical protein